MLKPTDIEEQRFEISFRGYNTNEVDQFMHRMQEEYTEIYKEFDSFSRKIAAADIKVQEADDRSDEFVASMKADREAADAYAAEKREEGERIIREAKNAASGIMAEVKRRAADAAKAAEAKAAAVMQGAKTESERLVAEANAEANKIIREAQAKAAQVERGVIEKAQADAKTIRAEAQKSVKDAETRAADADAYAEKVYATAEKSVREIERELRGAASTIALLARKPDDLPKGYTSPVEEPVEETVEETVEPEAEEELLPEVEAPAVEAPAAVEEKAEEPAEEDDDTYADAPVGGSIAKGGYFTEEYRQAMAELFGTDDGEIPAMGDDDDDTYSFYDKSVLEELQADADEDSDDGEGDGQVTSEYVRTAAEEETLSSANLDSIFKAPSDDDLREIFDKM